ncbi:MAG: hypothetical protein QM222_02425 [Bacillota bacterium]|jgi:hypothetical protein|nr:hypothetical protein [Bacillota bacterium]
MYQFKPKLTNEKLDIVKLFGEDTNCPCEVIVYNTCPTVNQNCSCRK